MWMALVSGLQGLASASADDAAKVLPKAEEVDKDIPGLDGKLPTAQQLLEVLDSMTGMSDEEKASLREDLLRNIESGATEPPPLPIPNDFAMQTIILLCLLSIVVLIFVFFVYKLFKCLSEREMKREEKKKNKQMKKKK